MAVDCTHSRPASARRALLAALCAALAGTCLAPTVAAARKLTAANWDTAAQRVVVKAGLMSELSPGNFSGAARLTPQAESQALGALTARREATRQESEGPTAPAPAPAVASASTVTLT
ncbi:MAG: hypothetical protein QOK19_495, partial [Solirubrobacteraceae bacterium]|nr:hypothetical protein [Solirubrobacteraceae bacterium]